jgi:hypothetical protein
MSDRCFVRAFLEYCERTWYPDDFDDLSTDVQSSIMERARQIQAADDRLQELSQAA